MDNSYYGQLRVFQTIVLEGNISAGARKLGIAVPSASQALRLLEEKIGVPLFSRSTRKIQLTDAGQQLFNQTIGAMQTLSQALDDIQNFGGEPTGTVRITLSRFAYQLLIKPFLHEFHQQFPQIQLEISLNDAIVNLIEDGFDLGIRFGNRLEEGVVARPLMNAFREGLYVSESYRQRFGLPNHPEELAHHQLIGYRFITSNRVEPLVLHLNGEDTALEMPTPLLCNDPEIIADSTRLGLGIGRIFEPNMAELADKADFIPVLEPYWRQYPSLYLYYLQHSQKSRKISAVIDYFLEKTAKFR